MKLKNMSIDYAQRANREYPTKEKYWQVNFELTHHEHKTYIPYHRILKGCIQNVTIKC